MDHYSALHRALGEDPGDFTDAMVHRAVEQGLRERDDLDWKEALPPQKSLSASDFPKDVAAMANSGGGVIVFGVAETDKAATGRVHQGRLDENYERTLRQVVWNDVHPPVAGVVVTSVGTDPGAVVVSVPASPERPHSVMRNGSYRTPVRNDADTVYMTEPQLAAAYAERFASQRAGAEELQAMFDREASRTSPTSVAWVVLVARPRVVAPGPSWLNDRDDARLVFSGTPRNGISVTGTAKALLRDGMAFLFDHNVDVNNPRTGFRSWVAAPSGSSETRMVFATLHRDGSVSLAGAVGGQRTSAETENAAHEVRGRDVESYVAHFMAMVRVSLEAHPGEFNIQAGFVWAGPGRLRIDAEDSHGYPFETGVLVDAPHVVNTTIDGFSSLPVLQRHARDLALDLVNQGGVTYLHALKPQTDP